MKLIIILFLAIAAVLVQADIEDSGGEDVIPVRRSMKGLHGHISRGNRRHVDHVDAKWDTSDMDVDDAPAASSRRALSNKEQTKDSGKSLILPSLTSLLPYVKTILVEIIKQIGGTKFEKLGQDALALVEDLVVLISS
ncbi:GSCOCG00010348001-RA-CDS [Cotesia congregata]|nr:GSCOCG00010348001-RA-CDS [Cotesia congregata]